MRRLVLDCSCWARAPRTRPAAPPCTARRWLPYFTCRLTPLPAELVILSPMIETWSLRAVDESRTESRWTVRCTDRSAEGMAKFETIAAIVRERASQPEYGAAIRAAIAEDAAVFGLDEPID